VYYGQVTELNSSHYLILWQ